jgi:PHD/YefM family antitoxin component YafN of YafNO toxin-antitoxin module
MKVEGQGRMVKRWEGDQKVGVVVTGQGSKMAIVIRESRWNAKHEYDANHPKKALDGYC